MTTSALIYTTLEFLTGIPLDRADLRLLREMSTCDALNTSED